MPFKSGPSGEGLAQLMPHFNTIMGAVERGGTTADIWAAYRAAAASAGTETGAAGIQEMNYMTGYARSILSAEQSLAAAEGGNVISGEQWAYAPWASGESNAWLADRYQVRYQSTMTGENGEQVPIWGVTDIEGSLEGLTKDQIYQRALVSAQNSLDTGSPRVAQQLGMLSGFSLFGIDRVQIMKL